jgi:hypothetical protein
MNALFKGNLNMTTRIKPLHYLLMLAIISTFATAANKKSYDYIPVSWNQLIPADYNVEALENEIVADYDIETLEHGSEEYNELVDRLTALQDNAPMTMEYDGVPVKIPGFIVPLDFDTDEVTNFLLVPYYGACIHTPPPPPNQIIYVTLEEGFKIENPYDPIFVNGLMMVDTQESEFGTAGYTVYGHKIEPYSN